MNNTFENESCKGCEYCENGFCLCRLPIYPCEEPSVEAVVEDIIAEFGYEWGL